MLPGVDEVFPGVAVVLPGLHGLFHPMGVCGKVSSGLGLFGDGGLSPMKDHQHLSHPSSLSSLVAFGVHM